MPRRGILLLSGALLIIAPLALPRTHPSIPSAPPLLYLKTGPWHSSTRLWSPSSPPFTPGGVVQSGPAIMDPFSPPLTSGDPKLLHEAILRVLSFDLGAWEKVFQRLREGVEVREGDPEAVEWVSQWCGVEAARVRQVLDFARAMQGRSSRGPSAMQLTLPGTDPFYSDDDPYWQRLLAGPLTGEVGNLLVALYVYCISQGRFASW